VRGVVQRFVEGGQPWTDALEPADLVLAPAACYPVYPLAAERGAVPAAGLTFDVAADCFRREPSTDIDRFQSFRMREYVRIGTAEQIHAFRDEWIDLATALADRLGLNYRVDLASDPFFGRGGQIVALAQIEQALKFELLVPVRSTEQPTACMSFNYHQDHFGQTWDLKTADGAVAHTGCVAFGMDRLAVAMFATHGPDPDAWPTGVRLALRL
jgi:seryl-tRNA synthetase